MQSPTEHPAELPPLQARAGTRVGQAHEDGRHRHRRSQEQVLQPVQALDGGGRIQRRAPFPATPQSASSRRAAVPEYAHRRTSARARTPRRESDNARSTRSGDQGTGGQVHPEDGPVERAARTGVAEDQRGEESARQAGVQGASADGRPPPEDEAPRDQEREPDQAQVPVEVGCPGRGPRAGSRPGWLRHGGPPPHRPLARRPGRLTSRSAPRAACPSTETSTSPTRSPARSAGLPGSSSVARGPSEVGVQRPQGGLGPPETPREGDASQHRQADGRGQQSRACPPHAVRPHFPLLRDGDPPYRWIRCKPCATDRPAGPARHAPWRNNNLDRAQRNLGSRGAIRRPARSPPPSSAGSRRRNLLPRRCPPGCTRREQEPPGRPT